MIIDKEKFNLSEYVKYFRHKHSGKVRFDEVDMLGIVHNLKYFYWLEWARLEYLNDTGFTNNPENFILKNPMITVHNEIDYFSPAKFNDVYFIYSRISKITKSSLTFDNLVVSDKDVLLAAAKSVLVNVNPVTGESIRITDETRELIKNYEPYPIDITE
jgi:acyl-CoA thioester hydrolase